MSHSHPSYHRIPKLSIHATLWANKRYRILQSSLSTLLALRDESEDETIIENYNRSIRQIQSEISALTVRS